MMIIGVDPGISGSICFFEDGIIKDNKNSVLDFLETLEEDDDVQNVYSNVNLGGI